MQYPLRCWNFTGGAVVEFKAQFDKKFLSLSLITEARYELTTENDEILDKIKGLWRKSPSVKNHFLFN